MLTDLIMTLADDMHNTISDDYKLGPAKGCIQQFYTTAISHLLLNTLACRFMKIKDPECEFYSMIDINLEERNHLSDYEIAVVNGLSADMPRMSKELMSGIIAIKSAPYYQHYPAYGPLKSGNVFKLFAMGVEHVTMSVNEHLAAKFVSYEPVKMQSLEENSMAQIKEVIAGVTYDIIGLLNNNKLDCSQSQRMLGINRKYQQAMPSAYAIH